MTLQARILQKNDAQRYTLGVVYEPDTVDTQGDFADASEIEKACWEFSKLIQGQAAVTKKALTVLSCVVKAAETGEEVKLDVTDLISDLRKDGGTGLGYMHALWSDGLGDIVENYILPCDTTLNGESVKKGSWLMGIVWAPEVFQKVQNNEITGLSLGGSAFRVPVEESDSNA